jgi:phospholipid/cholesterol/gamma-HCH transport system substrate-binding protein
MPRTRSLAWAELKVGIVSIFAIGMAGFMIFLLGGDAGFPWQRYAISAVFDDIAGLKTGAPVRVAGVETGSVSGIVFSGDKVELTLEITKDMQSRITDLSVASLGSISLLGESAVDITSSSKGTPIPAGGVVKTGQAVGSISDVAARAGDGIEAVKALVTDISSGKGTVGRLFTDDTLFDDLGRLLVSVEAVTLGMNKGKGLIGRLSNDPALAESLEGALSNLEAITADLKAGKGSLGQLLANDEVGKSLKATTASLDTLIARLNKGEGTAGKLLTDDALFNRLSSVTRRLDTVLGDLEKGQGTAGLLLHDRQLYDRLNITIGEVEGLVSDIRKDPKKFLNVKVSLF